MGMLIRMEAVKDGSAEPLLSLEASGMDEATAVISGIIRKSPDAEEGPDGSLAITMRYGDGRLMEAQESLNATIAGERARERRLRDDIDDAREARRHSATPADFGAFSKMIDSLEGMLSDVTDTPSMAMMESLSRLTAAIGHDSATTGTDASGYAIRLSASE